ncbi:chloride channel protein [Desulforhopalus singaporensis]|uniref:Chloride channel protein, CIC family n=1 Tax=Desulforhopalus singaporensis TaxID=91360 RepID=A0A1H0K0D5_9BACT|nr:chloride channel protein [Desulforhopalus singaporensis]SDO49334.1 chloride channel protein, CIC family [Desulforhopalus singaporensis]
MTPKRSSFSWYLDRLAPPEGLLLLILSVIVGATTGLASVFFVELIFGIQDFFYGNVVSFIPGIGKWIYVIVPVIGGLLVGPLILFAQEAKGHGVPEVMQALVLRGGRIRPRVAAAKITASALCIGTGGSAGREGPIIQVGAALGSALGQVLHLSDERIRNLVACGAAAGIAATFNAPIAGVAFAIEVLMCGLQMRAFGNVVIAAVSAAVVSRTIIGDKFAFQVPAYHINSSYEMVLYLILGLTAALVGIMFIKMLDFSENLFDDWKMPQLVKPSIGGLLLGLLGLVYMNLPNLTFPAGSGAHGGGLDTPIPHMYGAGFPFIEAAIQNNAAVWILVVLIFLKPLATSFTLGSGNSGGVFAPSLFIGAMLGGAMGHLFSNLFPSIVTNPGAFALVGMAALFSATARAPLTAMLIVFEMSNDYFMILPLMVAGVTASYFSQWLHPESIYTIKLAKRGVRFFEGRDMDIMQGVKVSEVMRSKPVTIHKDASFSEVMALFQETNLLGFPVLADNNKLWGIITLQDIHREQSKENFSSKGLKVSDIAVEEAITIFPDEPIWLAIQKMSPRDLARLPVVSRDGSNSLCGIISRSDILRAYDVGLVRKQRGHIVEHQVELRKAKENGYVDFVLKEEDSCNNARLKDLDLPETINMVSIKRGGQMIIPRGDTTLNPGDVITVYGKLKDIEKIKDLLNSCVLKAQ